MCLDVGMWITTDISVCLGEGVGTLGIVAVGEGVVVGEVAVRGKSEQEERTGRRAMHRMMRIHLDLSPCGEMRINDYPLRRFFKVAC